MPSSVLISAVAKNRLEDNGIDVKAVYYYVPFIAVIAVKPQPGVHHRIISILNSAHRLAQAIVFVDEDVDVTNVEEVWWAICTRMHPQSYEVVRGGSANPLMPYLTPTERERFEADRWVMDASFPYEWTPEYRALHTGSPILPAVSRMKQKHLSLTVGRNMDTVMLSDAILRPSRLAVGRACQ